MRRMCQVILARYGWPGEPGQLRRPPGHRVKALRWQLERFAEIVAWDDCARSNGLDGYDPFHEAMMSMRLYTGQYEGHEGDFLYQADVFIQTLIDKCKD